MFLALFGVGICTFWRSWILASHFVNFAKMCICRLWRRYALFGVGPCTFWRSWILLGKMFNFAKMCICTLRLFSILALHFLAKLDFPRKNVQLRQNVHMQIVAWVLHFLAKLDFPRKNVQLRQNVHMQIVAWVCTFWRGSCTFWRSYCKLWRGSPLQVLAWVYLWIGVLGVSLYQRKIYV